MWTRAQSVIQMQEEEKFKIQRKKLYREKKNNFVSGLERKSGRQSTKQPIKLIFTVLQGAGFAWAE